MGSAATLLSTLVVWMSGLMSLVVCAIASSPGCALGVAGLLLLTLAALALGMEADAKTICQQAQELEKGNNWAACNAGALEKSRKKHEDATRRVASLSQSLRGKEEELSGYAEYVKELYAAKHDLQQRIQRLEADKEEQEATMEQVLDDSSKLLDIVSKMQTQECNMHNRMTALLAQAHADDLALDASTSLGAQQADQLAAMDAQLRTKCSSEARQGASLKAKVSRLSEQLQEEVDMVQALSESQAETTRQAQAVYAKLRRTRQELSSTQQELSRTQQELSDSRQETANVRSELAIARGQLGSAQLALFGMQEQCSSMQQDLAAAQQLSAEWQALSLSQQQHSIAMLQEMQLLQQQNSELTCLAVGDIRLMDVNMELTQELQDATEQKQQLEIRCERLQDGLNEQQRSGAAALQHLQDSFDKQQQAYSSEVQRLQDVIELRQQEGSAEVRQLRDSLSEAEDRLAASQQQTAAVTAERDELLQGSEARAGLAAEVERLKQLLATGGGAAEVQESRCWELTDALGSVRDELRVTQEQLQTAHGTMQQLRAEVQELQDAGRSLMERYESRGELLAATQEELQEARTASDGLRSAVMRLQGQAANMQDASTPHRQLLRIQTETRAASWRGRVAAALMQQ